MISFTFFPAVSDVNVILSEGLFSHIAAHMFRYSTSSVKLSIVSFLRHQQHVTGDDSFERIRSKTYAGVILDFLQINSSVA